MSGTKVPKHHVGASEQFDLYHVLNPHARCQLAGVSLPETRGRYRHVAEEGNRSSCKAEISTNGEGPKQV